MGSLIVFLVLGAAAIYLLLPRPRPFPTWWGAGLGTLALVLAGILLVQPGGTVPQTILFYAFSAIAIFSGTMLISQHNPARAALSFTLVILSTCGLFLLLAAPFLMAATIVVYAGAIVVTFLFVLMLAQQAGLDDADLRSREPLFSVVAGFALLGGVLYVLQANYSTETLDHLRDRIHHALEQSDSQALDRAVGRDSADPVREDRNGVVAQLKTVLRGHGLKQLADAVENEIAWPPVGEAEEQRAQQLARRKELLTRLEEIMARARADIQLGTPAVQPHAEAKLSPFSGPSAAVPAGELRRDPSGVPQLPADNATYLGRSLFTDYLLAVELGGLLLLVAVVGAIAIAHRGTREETAA
jgi:NADH:ubiquinone oxidoreductase subunit 6 (subunit J)